MKKVLALISILAFASIFPWAEEPNIVRMPKAQALLLRKK